MEQLWDKVRGDLLAAWSYSKEAARLLRRHPALVLIPIAIAFFNGAEETAGRLVGLTRTAHGRAAVARARAQAQANIVKDGYRYQWGEASLRMAYEFAKIQALDRAVHRLSSGTLRPQLSGTGTFLAEAAMDPGRDAFTPLSLLVSCLVGLVALLLGTPIAAGYLGRLRRTVFSEPTAGVFWQDARSYAAPLVLYFIIAGLPYVPAMVILIQAAFGHKEGVPIPPWVMTWELWIAPLLMLFVFLTPMGIVRGRRFREAIGRSFTLGWKHYATALAITVATALLCFVVFVPYEYLRDVLHHGSFDPGGMVQLPLTLALGLLLPAITVWGVLTLFVWYREATAVTPAADDAAPAEA